MSDTECVADVNQSKPKKDIREDGLVHLTAGAAGGCVGAVLTCPLEVIKTRLQSSSLPYRNPVDPTHLKPHSLNGANVVTHTNASYKLSLYEHTSAVRHRQSIGLFQCISNIIKTEGFRALFKGLGPNLLGVAPSRGVYFLAYAKAKQACSSFPNLGNTTVHVISAACAGFSSVTCTNPIWFIKTRLQLDLKRGKNITAWQCARGIYRVHGWRGFYKGLTASYYGLSETIIHLVIYEELKMRLIKMRKRKYESLGYDEEMSEMRATALMFVDHMTAAAISKSIATCIAYPHEVVRTRLREEGSRYHTFWQTVKTVFREEGTRGLYRGLVIQLFRQIPNAAIMMATYELVVSTSKKIADWKETHNRSWR